MPAGEWVYWGKVIGTVAGLATTKPWFALLGLIIGHQFDRGFEARYQSLDDTMNGLGRLPAGYIQILFESMGHLAKSDGRVSEDEIRAARKVMHRLGLKPALVRNAIAWFNDGKRADYPLSARARELKRRYAKRNDLRLLFLRLLIEVSVSKSRVRSRERSLIWSVCEELDIGRVELAQLEAMIRAQKGFRKSPAGHADRGRVAAAYATLGIDPAADNDEIKKAYRRQMNRFHPDKLASENPDEAALAEAQKKTREIRSAYEMLKARRSIR
ncbi:MAG: co-chaperone DjlA [Woeseiaceae bacterium]|nr:co-chaperone DjlA [Woeseiaceae bacterium]